MKKILAVFMTSMMILACAAPVLAAEESTKANVESTNAETDADTAGSTKADIEKTDGGAVSEEAGSTGDKAMAAALTVGLAAAAGAIGMGWAIAKAADGISRQPEAEGKIRTTLMLGLVFIETAIIYALVIAILIIFVL